jgi:ubiquinone/menaquinone biosynthesis C-methylase UbiE
MADRSPARAPDPTYVTYSSAAYTAESTSEVEESTAAWLETQAQMPFIREVARRTFELMDLREGQSVLDVGCGTGVLLPGLAEVVGARGSVTGLDHSAAFLARAHRRLRDAGLDERVRLVHGDALAVPFAGGTFDVTHAERVLMHLPEPDAAIREMVRVTRPGGRVVSAEVDTRAVEYDQPDRELFELILQVSASQIRNPSMGIEVRRRFIEAGLEDVTVVVVGDVETRMDDEEVTEYRRVGRELVEVGVVEAARVDAAMEHLVRTNDAGIYSGMAVIFVTVGTVPGLAPDPAE